MFAIKHLETKIWVHMPNWVSTYFGIKIVFLSANTDLSSNDCFPN